MKSVKVYPSKREDHVVNPRDTMNRFPRLVQPVLSWVTGKPSPGETPAIKRSGASHLATAFFVFFLGLALGLYGMATQTFIIVPLGWLFAVSGARKLITTINHYAIHRDLFTVDTHKKYPNIHRYIADFISSMLFLQDFRTYDVEHHDHHKPSVTATMRDPDMDFMWLIWSRPGMSKTALRAVLILNLFFPFSPLHYYFVRSRIRTVIFKGTAYRYGIMLLTLAIVADITAMTGFTTVFWAIIFPLTYLYHISSLLQFASEHIWCKEVDEAGLIRADMPNPERAKRARRITVGRMMGSPVPDTSNMSHVMRLFTLTMWWLKMGFIHLPLRMFVLPGDLPQHDAHHRTGHGSDWMNAVYSRQAMIDKLQPNAVPFVEVWGLLNVIDLVLSNLSSLAPLKPHKEDIDKDVVMSM